MTRTRQDIIADIHRLREGYEHLQAINTELVAALEAARALMADYAPIMWADAIAQADDAIREAKP